MTKPSAILPKLGVFLVAAVVGGSIAYIAASAINRPQIVPTAGEAPEFTMTSVDSGTIVAFDLIDAQQDPTLLEGLSTGDLGAAADALLDESPPPGTTPLGFPRVPFVSQFDGSPFANANCTLASGAMLARLAFGIVTTGGVLRTLQFDQDGGTDLHDLNTAVFRGYGVNFHVGGLLPSQLKSILEEGGAAVIQGMYGELPPPLQVQQHGAFPHAIFVDGYFGGDSDTPPAYYILDPLGRGSYDGDWWPAEIVDDFALAFSGGDRIAAAWAFPAGGVPPPEIVDPDVLSLPGGEPESPPGAGASQTPVPSGGLPEGVEPGDDPPPDPPTPVDPPVLTPAEVADVDLVPILTVCVVEPPPEGCPEGIDGVFDNPPPILHVDLGPDITVLSVDSDEPNVAFVAFTIDSPAPVDVTFWEADGTPAQVDGASSIAALGLPGGPTFIARLDVLAGTEYHFQVLAGDGIFVSTSPVGSFTTGDGVKQFDLALASVADPVFELGGGFSPYVHLAADAFAPPLYLLGETSPSVCLAVIEFGGDEYCHDESPPASIGCQTVNVDYQLLGIAASSVLVQAFPVETAETDGVPTLDAILEASGPAGSGQVSVGCLASGLTYTIALDALGDPAGILASKEIAVP